MKVLGFNSQISRPSRMTLHTSPENLVSGRKCAPLRRAISSTNQNPALCRVCSYCAPGLPRPAIRSMFTVFAAKGQSFWLLFAGVFASFVCSRVYRTTLRCMDRTNACVVIQTLFQGNQLNTLGHNQFRQMQAIT